jgi:hypothetical protein
MEYERMKPIRFIGKPKPYLLVTMMVLAFLASMFVADGNLWAGKKVREKAKVVSVEDSSGASIIVLFDFDYNEIWGFWCVIITFFFLVGVIVYGNMYPDKDKVCKYRPYEEKLLHQGKLELKDIMDYHAQYSWGNYAAVTIGMVLISVAMLAMEGNKLNPAEKVIQIFAVVCMTAAAIGLCWADLLHTNTQTPIIPVDRRFKLIDRSVQIGTMGTMIMVLAVLFFVCMIDFVATLLSCATYIAIMFVVFRDRKIDKKEFYAYFLEKAKDWPEDEREIGKKDKRAAIYPGLKNGKKKARKKTVPKRTSGKSKRK